MRAILLGVFAVALTACASAPTPPLLPDGELLADALFPASEKIPDARDLFAISPPMQDYVEHSLAEHVRAEGPQRGLVAAMEQDLHIDYDSMETRDASEAFAARAGNCLSLVILTAALAKQMGLSVTYQSVYGFETWDRINGVALRSGHVNIVLGPSQLRDFWVMERNSPAEPLIVDFVPQSAPMRRFTREIPEETVVAMYLNNRAAEILLRGDVDRAYGWVRKAITVSPTFLDAYNTLGLVYRHHGNAALAERVLRYALERQPESAEVMTNLAAVLADQGRVAESQALLVQRAKIEPYPPYYFLDQGAAAMARGDIAGARKLFAKELARMPYDPEVRFAMAVAEVKSGDLRKAETSLALAKQYSTRRDRREIYAAKLRHLEQLEPR